MMVCFFNVAFPADTPSKDLLPLPKTETASTAPSKMISRVRTATACLAIALAPMFAAAQTDVATVAVGTTPVAVAANPVTHKIYVVNHGSNSVTIIDGATHATSTVNVEDRPEGVAINPKTNKIYIANAGADSVSVIDGVTNAVSTNCSRGNLSPGVSSEFGHEQDLCGKQFQS